MKKKKISCVLPPCSTTAIPSRARWRYSRPSNWPTSTTCRWPTHRGWLRPAKRLRFTGRSEHADLARQPGRRHHQWYGGTWPRRDRPAGGQAGDGRQGGVVQEVRQYRRFRPRNRGARSRSPGGNHRFPGADLWWHQPRRHQGAGVLPRREETARTNEDSGLSRRSAWHGDRRRRGDSQWSVPAGQGTRQVKLVTSGPAPPHSPASTCW
jgi:hypothetical protein